jgi:hypothetical protein
MIGTSLSGVTFMSVPGGVASGHFYYLQIVMGYFIGYLIVAYVLLPLYYRLGLVSIYGYLQSRFGMVSYRTGASFFILSRTLGASARIYLVLNVLQLFMLDSWGVPFVVTTATILAMILLYTYQGGVRTIVWTDTLQTTFMILALVVTVYIIAQSLGLSLGAILPSLAARNYSTIFCTDAAITAFFPKQLLTGIFITVAMTGLDQEMMQKNISCRSISEAQKNMLVFSITLVLVNALFLILGGVLYLYLEAHHIAIPARPDDVFPTVALQYLPPIAGLIFIIGLVSALFPSADGAITALTSSICIDMIGMDRETADSVTNTRKRKQVHLTVTLVFLICIMAFKWINTGSVISLILKIAGYTYGPLVALFGLGLYTRVRLRERLVPIVCVAAPLLTYILDTHAKDWIGYQPGFEVAFINVGITLGGLWVVRVKN